MRTPTLVVLFSSAAILFSASAEALPLVRVAEAGSIQKAVARKAPESPDYIRSTAISDMFEIAAGKVAQDKSRNSDVQHFAGMMVADHTLTSNDLGQTLHQNEYAVAPPTSLDQDREATLKALKDATGADFDRRYMSIQISAHEEAVRIQATYAKSGRDKPLRAFAASILPKIRAHLAMARQIMIKMNRVALQTH